MVYTVDPYTTAYLVCQTFDVLLLLTASEKVNDVFRVGYTVHKLLTEASSVERLKTSTVVHLGKAMEMVNLNVA